MRSKLSLAFVLLAVILSAGAFYATRPPETAPYVLPDVSTLPEATETQIVDLKDGDSYQMTAGFVRKEIGNRAYAMLAYNGSIPGPMLRVPEGANVTLQFTNGTGIETLLHSHGLRLDNASDGTDLVQEVIPPGGSFTYALSFPDAGACTGTTRTCARTWRRTSACTETTS